MSNPATSIDQLFPRGVAVGPAFCNRDDERAKLKANILAGQHSWIMGVRRYGKTSLVQQVARELGAKRSPTKVHAETIDLFVVHNLPTLEALIRDAVGRLSARFLPRNHKVLGQLQNFFSAFKPEITLSDDGFSLKLFSGNPSTQSIQRLLEALDAAAVHYKRRAVLVIDEFQQITQIDTKHTIEGAIRTVAQHTKALSFVFLGSEKTLLAQMFENSKRPLYRLCDKVEIGRIDAADYETFLKNAATLRWSKTISDTAMTAIFEITDRHPYYMNVLSRALWRRKSPPSQAVVESEWDSLLQRERSQAYQSLMMLATAQRAVLKAIAREPTDKPTSQHYLSRSAIAGSTMAQSLAVLMEKDFVRQTQSGVYEVIDPLVKGFLRTTETAVLTTTLS